MPDFSDLIESRAEEPSSASGDGQSVSQRPISEIIEAEKYLQGKEAVQSTTKGSRGLRFTKIIPPGAV